MEKHLKDALINLRNAQLEISHPGTTYEQLENMQNLLTDMLEDRVWE